MSLCQYKDALGIPGEGFHSYRFFNIAIGDVGLLLAVTILLTRYTRLSFRYALLYAFLLGVILHRVLCVRTTLDKLLFP